MSSRIATITIPGRKKESVPIVSTPPSKDKSQKRTPEWMIGFFPSFTSFSSTDLKKAIKLLAPKSSVNGFQNFTELFGFKTELQRYVDKSATGALLASTSLKQSPLVIVIPSGHFAADFESFMFFGSLINTIIIVRLAHVNDRLVILQEIAFSGCRITNFQQQLDRLIMHITVLKKETTIPLFTENGFPMGANFGEVDLEEAQYKGLGLTPNFF